MDYASIGAVLRVARKGLGMSQFEVAEKMGCSRAQVDNIEVARQRAPLYRLQDFARAVGQRMVIQIHPKNARTVSVRTTEARGSMLQDMVELTDEELDVVHEMVRLLPRLPTTVRRTLEGIITLWGERYGSVNGKNGELAG